MRNIINVDEYKTKSITEWIENCMSDIVAGQSIALVIKNKNGDYLTGYYKCDIREKNAMAKEIEFDAIDAFMFNNIGRYVERV